MAANLQNLDPLLAIVRNELALAGCTPGIATSVEMACEEAIVNIMHYAYDKDQAQDPYVELNCQTDKQLQTIEILIKDEGKPFNPFHDNPKSLDLKASAEDRDIGGLGIFFIQRVMDIAEYSYVDGKNCLKMVKKLS